MRGILAWILGVGLAANGLIMLAIPADWYTTVPGVSETGPFNPHFIRDTGVAYLVAGTSLPWFAINPMVRPAAVAGAAFLALHAIIHLWDATAGREQLHQLLTDIPTVFLPPVLAIWIVWPRASRLSISVKEKRDDQMVSAAVDP
ncbi:MAG: hypothetical protein ACLPX7_11705 [Xanthobacteraceae bacterium]